MPIFVVCPGCGVKLNAPDAAAGKRVKCPKPNCGTVVPVPAPEPAPAPAATLELPDEEAPPAPKKVAAAEGEDTPRKAAKPARDERDDENDDEDRPAKKRRAAAEDDEDDRPRRRRREAEDDEDDEDDRPARRRKRQKGGGLSPAVIAAIALGGLLLLAGVGYGIYALTKKDETAGPNPGGPAAPSNRPDPLAEWADYRSERDKFKIRTPKPMSTKSTAGGQREYKSQDPSGALVNVLVAEVKAGTPPGFDLRKTMETGLIQTYKNNAKFKNVTDRPVQYLGQTVTEINIETPEGLGPTGQVQKGRLAVRVVGFEKHVYVVMVGGPDSFMENANAVFDTFEYLK